MPLDGIGATFLTKELKSDLLETKVDRIYQPYRHMILIFFRQGRDFKKLLISANPSSPRIHLTTRDFVNPKSPPGFCMMLRKYLIGSVLTDITQPEYERVFIFKFSTINEFSEPEEKYLIAEIMGRHSNIIFLNEDKKIHDSIIHIDHDISSKREVMPARSYVLPPSQNKQPIEDFLESNDSILPFLNSGQKRQRLEKVILNNISGFSPLLSRAVVAESGLDDRLFVEDLTDEQKVSLSQAFYHIAGEIQREESSPTLYFRDQNDTKPFDFHCLEFATYPYKKSLDNFSMAMDVFFSLQDQAQEFSQEFNQIERVINRNIKSVQKKLDWHQKDYAEGQKADEYQKVGELLNSQLYLVKEGSENANIIDYYDPNQKEIAVPIKSHLSPADNAARYFKKYRKAKTKLKTSKKLLESDQLELKWLFSLQTALEKATTNDDLLAIKHELELLDEKKTKARQHPNQPQKHILMNALNPGKPGKKSRKKRFQQQKKTNKKQKSGKQELPLPPRKFVLDENTTILAGRNNIQNDELTFRTAKSDDLWFHAKDIPGTHVVLMTDNPSSHTPEQIETAASIAAWYAGNNQVETGFGGQVAVDYTLVKNVRKIKGARPGMVIYDNHKTCYVKPKLPSENE
ncbi:MAG: fibronectin/fibrinogen-binding protein [Clostridiaceae bacterium]|nr:fibronectin/fibrinogen-binding protein [Clostridiaceae bacterium]